MPTGGSDPAPGAHYLGVGTPAEGLPWATPLQLPARPRGPLGSGDLRLGSDESSRTFYRWVTHCEKAKPPNPTGKRRKNSMSELHGVKIWRPAYGRRARTWIVAGAHQQASFDAAGAPDAPIRRQSTSVAEECLRIGASGAPAASNEASWCAPATIQVRARRPDAGRHIFTPWHLTIKQLAGN